MATIWRSDHPIGHKKVEFLVGWDTLCPCFLVGKLYGLFREWQGVKLTVFSTVRASQSPKSVQTGHFTEKRALTILLRKIGHLQQLGGDYMAIRPPNWTQKSGISRYILLKMSVFLFEKSRQKLRLCFGKFEHISLKNFFYLIWRKPNR